MKKIILSIAVLGIISCKSSQVTLGETSKEDLSVQYANTINEEDLKKHLYILASDEYEGRGTGEAGHEKAGQYIKDFYLDHEIKSPIGGDDYFQEVPKEFLKPDLNDSFNVVAFIEGSEKPDEVLVISAHLDHIGIEDGQVFNGADDDGSGNVSILEIAEAFQKAVKDGHRPKRSIMFLHVTGEEKGLLGSKYYVDHPVEMFPISKTTANLNIDMVGRSDEAHKDDKDFVYLIGADKLSTELHNLSEKMNKKYMNINIDYTFNDENDPNRFYYRSDHYNFAKKGVPIIFYFNGVHEDYHKASDTPDKIDYKMLKRRAQLVFYTAWEIANMSNMLVVDKPIK